MTSCTCFSPGSGEGCPAAPTGTFPLSGPEGSPGAAPHCPADTACPEPGLTAARRVKRGAGRGAWHRGPSLRLLEVRASQRFRVPRESATGVSFKHFILFHQKTPLGAQSQAQMERTVTRARRHRGRGRAGGARPGPAPGRGQRRAGKARSLPGRGAAGANHRWTGERAHAGPAGPGTARDTPAHPGTPRSCVAARVPRRCWEPRRQLLLRTPAGRVC